MSFYNPICAKDSTRQSINETPELGKFNNKIKRVTVANLFRLRQDVFASRKFMLSFYVYL